MDSVILVLQFKYDSYVLKNILTSVIAYEFVHFAMYTFSITFTAYMHAISRSQVCIYVYKITQYDDWLKFIY